MKTKFGMRALGLLLIVALAGAVFVPAVSAENVKILGTDYEKTMSIQNTFGELNKNDFNWVMTNGKGLISISGKVPELKDDNSKDEWIKKMKSLLDSERDSSDLSKYMTVEGGPLMGYGYNYLSSVEIAWLEDAELDEELLNEIIDSFRTHAKEMGIDNLPIIVKYAAPIKGDIDRDDYIRPVIGGIRMETLVNGVSYAGTIGFAAKIGTQNGLVVSEHVVESTSNNVYQPTTVNPSYLIDNPTVLGGSYCDAAFIPYNNVEATILDSVLISQPVKGYSDPYTGQTVYMAGKDTQSYGTVTQVYVVVYNPDLGRYLYDQCFASYNREEGDSGAPVYFVQNHNRYISGIHVGYSAGYGALFSPISGIMNDLDITPLTR